MYPDITRGSLVSCIVVNILIKLPPMLMKAVMGLQEALFSFIVRRI